MNDRTHRPDQMAYEIAVSMWTQCQAEGQSARVVADDGRAEDVREMLRTLSHGGHVRIRTARIADTVVIAALDAEIWNEDAATMRAKLTPPERR